MKVFVLLLLLILSSCSVKKTNPKDQIDIDKALEIACPGVPKVLALRISKEDLREALRKQYTVSKDNVETVLKMRDGSNIMIPGVRPKDLDKCFVRSIPEIKIPVSTGY